MKRKVKCFLLFIAVTSISATAFAGQGYYLTVKNDTHNTIELDYINSGDFYPNDLGHSQQIMAGQKKTFYTEHDSSQNPIGGDIWVGAYIQKNQMGSFDQQIARFVVINDNTDEYLEGGTTLKVMDSTDSAFNFMSTSANYTVQGSMVRRTNPIQFYTTIQGGF